MNILLNGANGRMGKEVIIASRNLDNMNIVCGFDREENLNGEFPIYNKIQNIKENVDVIIDFSVPSATFEILKYAKENRIPTVVATTGFSEQELEKIKEISKQLPIFRSSNMSLDINLMASIVQKVAEVLKDNDIEIIETHHNKKIDSPSGTAILLADAINEVFNNEKEYNFDRMNKREKRNPKEIGFSAIRGGNIVGEHTVQFFSENETLEITHKSYSRQVFAEGALKSASFIVSQENGLYDMKNLVNN
ncbi:MAG: 4-hydroxy-tetrahydrodipicolinate reductase [Clostridia bacterium]|nr:4-hydroxy-tetrahydrodipicolinate reductase [Clostridia bacterium]